MVSRDFDAMLADQAGVRPTFKIAGQEFSLRARLPYAKWNKLLAYMREQDTDTMESTRKFFNVALIRADRQRFMDLLSVGDNDEDDDDTFDEQTIGLDQMGPLTDWVMEHFTGKLQSNTNGSSPGASATGQPQNVVSLNSRGSAG